MFFIQTSNRKMKLNLKNINPSKYSLCINESKIFDYFWSFFSSIHCIEISILIKSEIILSSRKFWSITFLSKFKFSSIQVLYLNKFSIKNIYKFEQNIRYLKIIEIRSIFLISLLSYKLVIQVIVFFLSLFCHWNAVSRILLQKIEQLIFKAL
jgi:hypothetical protein